MKKLLLVALGFGCFFALSDVQAQSTAQSSTNARDEYWGTSKVQTKGTSTDAVGRRGMGMDIRFNEYESKRGRKFEKSSIAKSKRMKEIMKREEEMMKKHRRDKKRLKRQRN